MGKSIYWIDDSCSVIMNIVKTIFPKFWKLDEEQDGIETHIRIFGNDIQESPQLVLWDKNDVKGFQQEIIKLFEQLCRNYDDFSEESLFERNRHLICDNIKFLYTQEDTNEKEIEEYRKLYQMWSGDVLNQFGDGGGSIIPEARSCAKQLLEKLDIEKGACVGLDLALFWGDIKRVRDENKPILSMELYNMIKEQHECFLYSYYYFDTSFINAWQSVYAKIYHAPKPIIHRRRELYAKHISDSIIHELLTMVEKSYERLDV